MDGHTAKANCRKSKDAALKTASEVLVRLLKDYPDPFHTMEDYVELLLARLAEKGFRIVRVGELTSADKWDSD